MAKFVNEGLKRVGDILFGAQAVDATLYLGLYKNIAEPAVGDALVNLTEHSGDGYARIALSRGDWTVSPEGLAEYAEQTFTANGGDWGNIYGYFIATSSDNTGKLLAVETFSDGPYDIKDNHSVRVTPKIDIS
jgi:hypothetical protein